MLKSQFLQNSTVRSMQRIHTHITHIERNFQIIQKTFEKFRIQCQHIQQIFPMYFMQITIGQCPYIAIRLAQRWINAHILTEDVVLACVCFGE